MIAFIDDHREVHGVEPICRMLPIAPSTYHARVAQRADPAKVSPRARQDLVLMEQIRRVHAANFGVYGARKVWRQLGRDGVAVARCTVERLMRRMGLRGAVRGKETRTTVPDKATPCPADKVNRQFRTPHPNALWVSDFTYVATWQGFVYVAFVIDVFARRIVGWRVSRTAHADFVLDALEQALLWSRRCSGAGAALEQALLWSRRCSGAGAALEQALHDRRPAKGGLIHHSDRGGQYVAIRYTERLLEAGIEPSVGSVGDSYDNALAETVIGLFKTEVIRRRGPWRSLETVEYATLDWVDWYNNRRLLEPIGNMPPAEAEARYYAQLEAPALAA
jgi:putative transposase